MNNGQMAERPEIRFHDEIAQKWETLHRGRVFLRRTRTMFRLLDEEISPGHSLSQQHWIDAGCGTGTLSRRLSERGCTVAGFDASEEMLDIAARTVVSNVASTTCSFHLIDTIERLPVADRSCDGVLCASVLEYTADPERCIAEFFRVLRPDGLLLLSIPNRHSLARQLYKTAYALSLRTMQRPIFRYFEHSIFEASIIEASRLLQLHGFDVISHSFSGSSFPDWLDGRPEVGTLINILARRHGHA